MARAVAFMARSATNIGRGHSTRMTTTRGISHGSSFRSAHTGFHSMRGMGQMGSLAWAAWATVVVAGKNH